MIVCSVCLEGREANCQSLFEGKAYLLVHSLKYQFVLFVTTFFGPRTLNVPSRVDRATDTLQSRSVTKQMKQGGHKISPPDNEHPCPPHHNRHY